MATSTSYNAAYVGVVQGAAYGRYGVNASNLATVADATATAVQTALTNPSLSAAKQNLLTAIVAGVVSTRSPDAVLASAVITLIAAEYAALTSHIVD